MSKSTLFENMYGILLVGHVGPTAARRWREHLMTAMVITSTSTRIRIFILSSFFLTTKNKIIRRIKLKVYELKVFDCYIL